MRKILRDALLLLAAAAFLGVAVPALMERLPHTIKSAHAQPSILGPQQFNLTVGTAATLNAVVANPVVHQYIICNGNATAANTITATWGTVTPVSGTTGLVIPGGNAVASCWYSPVSLQFPLGYLQLNLIAAVASTPVTVFQF